MEQSLLFGKICKANGLAITPAQLELFAEYAKLLAEWNAKLNLVSRKDEENIWASHLLHCVAPLFSRSVPQNIRLLDIGTGGGLPGIPLAILNEGWSVTLMDSIGKKVTAVQDIVTKLGLKRVDVVNGRAEDEAVRRLRRGRYEVIVARGVAPLIDLAKWGRPYLTHASSIPLTDLTHVLPVPSLVAYKGGDLDAEVKVLRTKMPAVAQWVGDLVFSGSVEAGLEGKKLVILQFP